jgi:hypothetical protein
MRALTILAMATTLTAAAQSPKTLAELRDTSRPLLIFAPTPGDPQLEIQLRTLNEHAPEAADRNLVPIAIIPGNPSPTSTTLTGSEAEAARRRFRITPADFTVILLGKDGGEKLRSHKPLTMRQLNSTIDSMPMRQEEMRSHR